MGTPINYIEFKATDIEATKKFYNAVFGWEFTDYGPTYTSFSESHIAGGFEYTTDKIVNGALIVLLNDNLKEIKSKVKGAGGTICKDIFSFPGGERFEFFGSIRQSLGCLERGIPKTLLGLLIITLRKLFLPNIMN